MTNPDPVPQRIGDAERDEAAESLRDHLVAGRLTQEEFDTRIDVALNARTAAELSPLFVDLPGPRPGALVKPEPELPADQTHRRAQELMAEAKARNAVSETRPEPNRALMILSAVAWPVTLLLIFATNWGGWWLIFLPIIISAVAGNDRRSRQSHHRELDQ